jgi:hypothetical protein
MQGACFKTTYCSAGSVQGSKLAAVCKARASRLLNCREGSMQGSKLVAVCKARASRLLQCVEYTGYQASSSMVGAECRAHGARCRQDAGSVLGAGCKIHECRGCSGGCGVQELKWRVRNAGAEVEGAECRC